MTWNAVPRSSTRWRAAPVPPGPRRTVAGPLHYVAPMRSRGTRTLLRSLRETRLLFLTALVAVTARLALAGLGGWSGAVRDVLEPESFQYLLLLSLPTLSLALLVLRLEIRDPAGRWISGPAGRRLAADRFREDFLNPGSLARALVTLLALALIINTYGSWKRVMPDVHPFSWDARLANLDRALHFGTEPWQLLQGPFRPARRTMLLDYVYFSWLPLIFFTIAWLIWTRRVELRTRGLLGVAFVWIGLGSVAATVFSSAGPAFYGHLVPGPDPFRALLDHLSAVATTWPVASPHIQDTLWRLHARGQTDIYTGISAMPSVHVAMPALMAMVGWNRNRLLGAAFWLYTLLVLVATVGLGWHYAVDGYVSIAAVALYWKLSGRIPTKLRQAS